AWLETLTSQRQNSDRSIFTIDDQNATYKPRLHQPFGFLNRVILVTCNHLTSHNVANLGCSRIAPYSGGAHVDVAVGQHSYDVSKITDRQWVDLRLLHSGGGFMECVLRPDAFDAAYHHIFDLHGVSPVFDCMATIISRRQRPAAAQ